MIKLRTALLSLLCFSSFAHPPQLQTARAPVDAQQLRSIDAFVQSEMAREKIPGLAVGIYSRGEVLLTKGYGLANVELNVPVKPETMFQSGSVGKQFVSAAIMMLVEEGKLSLGDSVTKFFPEAPATWKPIRIENLLSHTSGLAEYESGERTGPKGPFYLRLDYTEDELVQRIEALPIEWAPGENWAYRNTNYVLLGVVIHKITGKFYADFLAERIFKPLGMTSTRLISESDIIPNRAAGYELHDGQLKNQEWVSPTFNSTADGALYYNVIDLSKWDAALYTTRLLKQSSLDRIWTVYPLNNGKPNLAHYGFAWVIDDQNGHRRLSHGGAWQGFTCEISRYPDDSLAVVVLTNLDAAHSQPGLFARVIAGIVEPPLMPAKLAPIPDKQPAIAAKLRSVLDQLVGGQDISSQLTPDVAAELGPEARKYVQKTLAPVWPGGTLTLVQRTPSVSRFRLQKGAESFLIVFGLNGDGKISSLGLSPDRDYE